MRRLVMRCWLILANLRPNSELSREETLTCTFNPLNPLYLFALGLDNFERKVMANLPSIMELRAFSKSVQQMKVISCLQDSKAYQLQAQTQAIIRLN